LFFGGGSGCGEHFSTRKGGLTVKPFLEAYELWMDGHLTRRSGEELKRLKGGHGLAKRKFLELIWWPAAGSFEGLHPEYGVYDRQGERRYIDFAYKRHYQKVAMVVLEPGSSWRMGSDCAQLCDFVNDGWWVLPFAYPYFLEQPAASSQAVQQTFERLSFGADGLRDGLDVFEERIVRRVKQGELPEVTPAMARDWLGVNEKTARNVLRGLVRKQVLGVEAGLERVRRYRVVGDLSRY
jgi:hypothetical protein